MQVLDVFFHRHMFTLLAGGGTVAEWLLACWLFPSLAQLSPGAHAGILSALLALNRVAARILDQDPPRHRTLVLPARVVTAAAFTGLAGGAVLAGLIVVSRTLDVVGMPSVEASVAGERTPLPWPAEVPVALPLVALAMGSVAYGYARGHRRMVVARYDVPCAGLPPALEGFRLVHLSDLHVGPMADVRLIREAVDRVLALDPDVVCITGDIVDSPASNLDRWLPELARLEARHGVFAILGNHDRICGADRVAAALRRGTAWSVLRDETATILLDGGRLHIVGLEDRAVGAPAELPRLLLSLPAGEPVVLLAHRPGVFAAAASACVALTLAGHTHGGQLAMPGAPRLNVARFLMGRFDAGLFTAGRSTLHVSRGIGVSGQPVRIGVPREIGLLTLGPGSDPDRLAAAS